MKRLTTLFRSFYQNTQAVTSIEYALLASLIAMVIVISVTTVGGTLASLWNWVAGCVANLGCA